MAPAPQCPIDRVALVPMQGSEEFLFICTAGCRKTYIRRSTGELEEALPPPSADVLRMLPRFLIDQMYARTDASVARLETSSTGLVDRLERVETSLSDLAAKVPAADRSELERIRQDTTSALESARGAQGASRKLQEDLRSLQKAIEDVGLTTLRARIDELEKLVDRHIKTHQ